MKISIDFDGTLWSHMNFFRNFMQAFQTAGHCVGILTGHPIDQKAQDLKLMKARGFPTSDFYFGNPGKATSPYLTPKAPVKVDGKYVHYE